MAHRVIMDSAGHFCVNSHQWLWQRCQQGLTPSSWLLQWQSSSLSGPSVGMQPSTSPPKVVSPPLGLTAPLDTLVPHTHSLPLPHLPLPSLLLLLAGLATAAHQRLRRTSSELAVTRQRRLQQTLIQSLLQWHQSSLLQWLPPPWNHFSPQLLRRSQSLVPLHQLRAI